MRSESICCGKSKIPMYKKIYNRGNADFHCTPIDITQKVQELLMQSMHETLFFVQPVGSALWAIVFPAVRTHWSALPAIAYSADRAGKTWQDGYTEVNR